MAKNEIELSKKFKKYIRHELRGAIFLDMQSNPQDGVSDFIIGYNGKVIFVELKVDHKWTGNQKFFKFKCDRNGLDYLIIRDESEFPKVVEKLEIPETSYTLEACDDLCEFTDVGVENMICR